MSYLFETGCKLVEGIFLVPNICAMDQIAWKVTCSGQFTVKTTYALLLDVSSSSPNLVWKHLWSVSVFQRICYFVWLLLQEKLMTNRERWKWGFTQDMSCFFCGTAAEDIPIFFEIAREPNNSILVFGDVILFVYYCP